MRIKKSKFSTVENVQKYVNFISDNDLGNKLDNYETGFNDSRFFLDIEGPSDIINKIKAIGE